MATHSLPADRIKYHPRFACPDNPIYRGKPDPPQYPHLSNPPHPFRTRATKRTRRETASEEEEETGPRRSDG